MRLRPPRREKSFRRIPRYDLRPTQQRIYMKRNMPKSKKGEAGATSKEWQAAFRIGFKEIMEEVGTRAFEFKQRMLELPAAQRVIALTNGRFAARWAQYQQLLLDYPVVTNSVTAGALYALGDFAAQCIEAAIGVSSPDKTSYNYMRTLRMTTFGALVAGPWLALW